ncbi:MAG TPA: glycosyltransferase [Candidatus Acidoferrales bacterium]|jgi:teichuronic acid biosynthesis glycosyltransferase TuaC|nr:glycosyltransferase [Candidatus Acidoferrales bacterium]
MTTINHRPRIAAISHFFPSAEQPHRGIPLYHRMEALRAYADVDIYCVDPLYPSLRVLQPRRFQYAPPAGGGVERDSSIHYVRYPALPVLSRPWNGRSCAQGLLPILAQNRPDLILGFFAYPEGDAAIRVGSRLDVPVVVGLLGSDVRMTRGITRLAVRRVLRRADFVTGVSQELCHQAIRLGASPDRIAAIPNGCDATMFRPSDRCQARSELGIRPDAELVLFVGRLIPLKGLRELFQAVAGLARTHPRLELACIGEGYLMEELRSQAAQNMPERVRLLGGFPPETVARWLAAANLLCLPSYSEGCPSVVIEALSSGRPVVATDVGGVPELVDENCGILTRPHDPAALCQALESALNRPWDDQAIAAHSHRGWDDVGKELFAICEQVLGTTRQHQLASCL